jgi:hypothetical protein
MPYTNPRLGRIADSRPVKRLLELPPDPKSPQPGVSIPPTSVLLAVAFCPRRGGYTPCVNLRFSNLVAAPGAITHRSTAASRAPAARAAAQKHLGQPARGPACRVSSLASGGSPFHACLPVGDIDRHGLVANPVRDRTLSPLLPSAVLAGLVSATNRDQEPVLAVSGHEPVLLVM